MNIPFIKFLSAVFQKVLVTITANMIYKLIKDILLLILLFIIVIIVALVLIQYSGLYDIYGFLIENFQ